MTGSSYVCAERTGQYVGARWLEPPVCVQQCWASGVRRLDPVCVCAGCAALQVLDN
jgi:hypothetical protein